MTFKCNPRIKVNFFRNKTIVFKSPPKLRGITVHSVLDASMTVRKQMCFPYADWVITDNTNPYWTIWMYEKAISASAQQPYTSNTSSTYNDHDHDLTLAPQKGTVANTSKSYENVHDSDDSDSKTMSIGSITSSSTEPPPPPVIDPCTLSSDEWTSNVVSKWIQSSKKPELKLVNITHFRRYGKGLQFEFICLWNNTNAGANSTVRTWTKYTDLRFNSKYYTFLLKKWDPAVEQQFHWEQREQENSDYDEACEEDVF